MNLAPHQRMLQLLLPSKIRLRSPCPKVHLRSPCSKAHLRSLCPKVHLRSPCLKVHSRSPCLKVHLRSPCLNLHLRNQGPKEVHPRAQGARAEGEDAPPHAARKPPDQGGSPGATPEPLGQEGSPSATPEPLGQEGSPARIGIPEPRKAMAKARPERIPQPRRQITPQMIQWNLARARAMKRRVDMICAACGNLQYHCMIMSKEAPKKPPIKITKQEFKNYEATLRRMCRKSAKRGSLRVPEEVAAQWSNMNHRKVMLKALITCQGDEDCVLTFMGIAERRWQQHVAPLQHSCTCAFRTHSMQR